MINFVDMDLVLTKLVVLKAKAGFTNSTFSHTHSNFIKITGHKNTKKKQWGEGGSNKYNLCQYYFFLAFQKL